MRSVTGSNIRNALLNTWVQIVPGKTQAHYTKKLKVHTVPAGEEHKVPLLHSLLSIRSGEYKLEFDDIDDETEIVDDVLHHVCTS